MGWGWISRPRSPSAAATVTRPFTLNALGPGFEVEGYRERGYHTMDDFVIRKR